MADKSVVSDWDFSRESRCFNCGKEVSQQIKITPNDIIVTCSNCGAERHYIIRSFLVAEKKEDFELSNRKRKYDVWRFKKMTRCANCLNDAEQEIVIDEHVGTVVCPVCNFTRIYRFSVFSRPDVKK
ncbi:MAG TPA: hypothetical protein VK436_02900 [Methanocella sp.]|nr:hypothetical protein [Methanocella sp.]